MPMPTSPTRLFVCDSCGATLPVEPAHAGKKCRCGQCGKVLIVPGDSPKAAKPKAPKLISFNCILCDTRLTAKVKDVGLKAKCPDCGKLTKVPPLPKPRPKNIPKAMHGQQYGLWEVDEAPLPKEIAARQPKFYPVWCGVCDTLMHAQEKQLGKKLTCPDCGAKTVFKKLPVEEGTKSVMVEDGEEYQLDEEIVLPKRPVYRPPKIRDVNEFDAHEEALRKEYRERAAIPKVPLIAGVLKMMFRSPLPEAIFVLAVAISLELWFVANAMANVSGMALAIVMLSYAITAVFGLLSLMAASAFWLAVLKESSEGNDRLYTSPGAVLLDWAGECFFVVFAGAMSVAPVLLIGNFFPNIPNWAGPVAATISWLLLFPIFLLSQLENGSPMEFFSPKLASTVLKCPWHWLLFYSEALLLLGCSIVAIFGLPILRPELVVVSALIGAASSFLYFRLLGRLAWWLAESIPEVEDDE